MRNNAEDDEAVVGFTDNDVETYVNIPNSI